MRSRVKRWGVEMHVDRCDAYEVKLLSIVPGKSTSFHHHDMKRETIIVISGMLTIQWDVHRFTMHGPGSFVVIPINRRHAMLSTVGCTYAECSTPDPNDSDSVRDGGDTEFVG